jgi:hypothetical protein
LFLAVLEVTMANLYARSLGYKVEITQKILKKDKEIHIGGA